MFSEIISQSVTSFKTDPSNVWKLDIFDKISQQWKIRGDSSRWNEMEIRNGKKKMILESKEKNDGGWQDQGGEAEVWQWLGRDRRVGGGQCLGAFT